MPLPLSVALGDEFVATMEPSYTCLAKNSIMLGAANEPLATSGRCIYCDAATYSTSRQALGGEHIIARGLGGNLELKEASCATCEHKINSFETPVINELIWAPRAAMKIISRTHSKGTAKLYSVIGGHSFQDSVPIASHPTLLLLPIMPPPARLRDSYPGTSGVCAFWLYNINFTKATLTRIRTYAAPALDTVHFSQLLAKTAHSFAMAMLGSMAFKPYLRTVIRRKFAKLETWRARSEFVGGCGTLAPPTDALHEIECGWLPSPDRRLLLVHIRFFAYLGGPTYVVVAGQHP